ncbi:hypothetical protein [Kitasatospora sp. NPDC085464]|uniref:hypothetical protein n=1 Tax=Kitasatospora sp. NPDC085464 TaxID=3364063 RepID=UPI0037CC2D5E
MVDEAPAQTGRVQARVRNLPSRVGLYLLPVLRRCGDGSYRHDRGPDLGRVEAAQVAAELQEPRYTPVAPSMRSLTRSAWPLWRAYSSIMWT